MGFHLRWRRIRNDCLKLILLATGYAGARYVELLLRRLHSTVAIDQHAGCSFLSSTTFLSSVNAPGFSHALELQGNFTVVQRAELCALHPVRLLTEKLSQNLMNNRVLVLNFDTSFCPSQAELRYDNSSEARLRGTLGYRVGSIQWWRIILHSVGLSIHDLTATERYCFMHTTSISSRNCDSHCLRTHELRDTLRKSELLPQLAHASHASCAVVMNAGLSGAFFSPLLGDLIDTHPFVIRMNYAKAGGVYSQYVGQKSQLRIGARPVQGATSNHSFDFAKLPESFRKAVQSCVKVPHGFPTTGMNSIAIALNYCDRVVVFGKSLRIQHVAMPHHYYDKSHTTKAHDWDVEDDIFEQLDSANCLRVVP